MMRRREHKRVPVKSEVYLWDEIEECLIGQLCNVSYGGLLVLTERQLPIDAVFQLRVQAAQEDAFPAFSVGVETLWAHPANHAGSSWVGMQIIDLSEQGAQRLKDLMQRQE
jgi:hypothetical protein